MKTRSVLSGLWLLSMASGAVLAFAGALPSAGCSGGVETEDLDGGTDGPGIILDGGGDPIVPPNGESLCPQGACNYQTSSGCGAGQGCVPVPDGQGNVAPTCITAGQGTSGAQCQSLDQCAPGYLCAGGQCRKLCCGGDWTGCPSESEHCIQNLSISDGNGGVLKTGAMLCQPVNNCSAIDPYSSCGSGTACLIVDPTGATACFPEGPGGAGEACPCKGGFLCVDGACRRLCKAVEGGGEPSCQDGEGDCVHFNRDPQGVGECTP